MSLDTLSSVSASGATASLAWSQSSPRSGARTSPEDVKKAAQQFEAILMRQLLAPAIEPMMNGSLGGAGSGGGGGVYGFMLTDVLANSISQGGGLGLSTVIQSQLSPRAESSQAPENHE